ncbi:hypothetical protein ACFYM2_21150 [Streptomyces sp. NPDC006711]|uniref:hypothetical protein n=1 Tax=Streptomyces sp. NPDC006711 TaxID=3364762 RepID=UPI0036960145
MRLFKFASFRVPRSSVSDVVDLAGLGCLVGAAWWWVPVVGLVVTGLVLLLVGWVVGNEPDA